MNGDRVLIVANRLPVTVTATPDGAALLPSSGGLASGLRAWHERGDGLWFGWPGEVADAAPPRLVQQLAASRLVPLHLSASDVERYYGGFANSVLWPLFHYSIDRVPIDAGGWAEYQHVNEAFAAAVAREYRPGDTIWVHDYHLLLVPALLRQRLPNARIGFFLHTPFPASEVFRVLPWRHEILHGLLGADLIGFHTDGYLRHFLTSLLHVDGIEPSVDRVRVGEREVRVGVFPMGIDAAAFAARAADPRTGERVEAIRADAGGRRLVLGVDRVDYTKGIPRRLEAIARLLEPDPRLRDEMRYIQLAVPSRGEIASYQRFRRDIEEMVGRINGAYGTLRSTPVHFLHQSVSPEELAALYRAADVMLVAPLRDGMNLVAKEFAASRIDEDGVLVLSEFAGAAAELQGALTVNPYDVSAVADSIRHGLAMPLDERRARMRTLRRRVCAHDVFAWADAFTQALRGARADRSRVISRPPEPSLPTVLAEARRAKPVRLLLDYDGTLVPIARSPELALPDDELMWLLARLAASPRVEVDIVSGRPREALERWFGALPLSLWAEHGLWHRACGTRTWEASVPLDGAWMPRVKPILDRFAASTPGARVEVKTASMAWHYREAPREFGSRQAHELRLLLGDLLSNQPVEVLEGKKILEVRMRGAGKGLVARRVYAESGDRVALVAFGDDRTDDELFRALPPGAISVAVGQSTAARFRVADHRSVRRLLTTFVEEEDSSDRTFLGVAASA